MNKYEMLYKDKIEIGSHILYRIRALKDFGNVKAGDIGGYIEREENLSQEGICWVFGNAKVYDSAKVFGNAKIYGSAKISKVNDILCIAPIGSRNGATTFFKTKDNNIRVKCGCFTGTIGDFLDAVEETHGENKHAKAYKLACELARVQIELEDVRNERNII